MCLAVSISMSLTSSHHIVVSLTSFISPANSWSSPGVGALAFEQSLAQFNDLLRVTLGDVESGNHGLLRPEFGVGLQRRGQVAAYLVVTDLVVDNQVSQVGEGRRLGGRSRILVFGQHLLLLLFVGGEVIVQSLFPDACAYQLAQVAHSLIQGLPAILPSRRRARPGPLVPAPPAGAASDLDPPLLGEAHAVAAAVPEGTSTTSRPGRTSLRDELDACRKCLGRWRASR